MAGGLLPEQIHYAESQVIADPAGNGDCEGEGDSTSNEDETNNDNYRETYGEFFLRHMQNMIHFLVEDWFISAMLGFITAILSISVDLSYEYLNHYKVIVYDQAMKVDRIVGFSAWVMYIVTFVGLGAIVCKYISKHAIGSGIPEVKVIMNGFMLQNYLTFRTLVAKVAGLVLTLGSGLPVGKEGPFVHMGAIVATLLAKATRPFQHNAFYSNEGRDVEILSSGCAVGIACTFSAPAGAVLYGIESTHKYFAVKSYWRSFFATTCSAILFRFANYAIIPKDIAGSITAYYQTSFPNEVFVVEEIPIFALIGIMSGLLGAAFLILHKRISKFIRKNRIFLKVFGKDGFAFTIFMAFVVGVITFPAGVGSYVHGRYNFRETLSDLISNCSMTLYNTSISRGCSQEMVFRWTADAAATTPNVMPTLLGYFLVMFVLVPICITLAVPAGIFVPAFVIGACGGRIVGEVMVLLFPDGMRGPLGPQIYPGLYAVVGAAAFTGAVTHSLSIAVIVCETTGQLSPLLPVLIALMIGNAVASFLHPSIYESIIMLKKYPHLTELPPSRMSVHTLKVEQIMVKDIVYITKDTTYKELRELLISTPQLRSYPLVTDDEERILLGSVARKYLNFLVTIHLGPDPGLLARRRSQAADMFGTYNRTSVMRTSMSGHTLLSNSPLHENLKKNGLRTSLSFHRKSDPSLAESVLLDRAMKLEKPIDIDSLAIDSAPFQLVLGTSLFKVHTLFSLLGLNHAYVTHRGRLVGVVALRELRLALSDIYVRGAVPNKESSCGSVHRLNDFHIDKPEIIKGNKSYYNGTLSVPKDVDGFSGISINIQPPIEEEDVDEHDEDGIHEETFLLEDITHIDGDSTDEEEEKTKH